MKSWRPKKARVPSKTLTMMEERHTRGSGTNSCRSWNKGEPRRTLRRVTGNGSMNSMKGSASSRSTTTFPVLQEALEPIHLVIDVEECMFGSFLFYVAILYSTHSLLQCVELLNVPGDDYVQGICFSQELASF
mmetsp:Transcript_45207/g.142303  ORF Transcript_45207/g.142303 Transcript_45207/m.142303 type:complete len:133 (-) Transcript_45207:2364-2762(-)